MGMIRALEISQKSMEKGEFVAWLIEGAKNNWKAGFLTYDEAVKSICDYLKDYGMSLTNKERSEMIAVAFMNM